MTTSEVWREAGAAPSAARGDDAAPAGVGQVLLPPTDRCPPADRRHALGRGPVLAPMVPAFDLRLTCV